MPFAPDTRDRVISALEMPFSPESVSKIDSLLSTIYSASGEGVVDVVETELITIEELESTMLNDAGNGALIQADVLRWEPGGKTVGFAREVNRRKVKLRKILGLTTPVNKTSMRLTRS